MARLSYGLMAALLVACSFTTLVYADVQIGEITVSDTAARYDGVSEAVCEIFAAMDFEPYDWSAVKAVYEEKRLLGNKIASLEDLALEGSAKFTGEVPEVWTDFQEYFDDETWLDTGILLGIDGASEESDGAREELVQKYPRDALGASLVLGMFETAIDAYEDGDTETALEYVEAAWVLYHGFEDGTGCATYGTGVSRARNFGFEPSDVIESVVAAFTSSIDALSDDSDDTASVLESAYEDIKTGLIKTYLRAAIRYGNKMDGDAEADDGLNLRVNQLEGYAFFNAIAPFAGEADADAAAMISAKFDPEMYAPAEDGSVDLSAYEDVRPAIEEAVSTIIAALGISEEEFGILLS